MVAGGLGLSIQQDVVTFVGAFGPFGRFHYVGDVYSVIYNEMVERDLAPLAELTGFWPGWERFTQLLKEDAQEVGEPLKFPGLTYTLPKVELDKATLGADLAIYSIYRGDVDSMELLLTLLTQYMPETVGTIPLFFKDLEGMFSLYAEWARERFLGQPASPGGRVLSKVILLADYRWYLLTGDLLSMIEPIFTQDAFSEGINWISSLIRVEAEHIRVAGEGV
ncbi:hypothetical protein ES703_84715 [subsurface metagenome]